MGYATAGGMETASTGMFLLVKNSTRRIVRGEGDVDHRLP